ncbi:putative diphthamide synthesis protein-domain-containing protein [Mycena alexandri]|uniref:2-(3-amino-3-carboxypropyl)histidine synthase subunit 2 n=1 Tax=Mycena alexandri TaxID=1745969 RepID=A0AAD6S7W1_9AGAR|nr:putative diphthamide synthesis protein-domain-containing protein [Mycena alexandri]
MAENTTFSTSGADAISRTIDVQPETTVTSPSELGDFYEIERTIAEILAGDYKRVALQFPDELLHDSVPIYRRLKAGIGLGRELYVLADTSYGSCCVDEVAAQHVDADAMVHYGHACMSQTSRLPVIYVFGKKAIDVEDCAQRLAEVFEDSSALLRYDVAYAHQAESIASALRRTLNIPITTSQIHLLSRPSQTPPAPDPEPESNNSIIYIGPESLALTNLLLTHSMSSVYSYDPLTNLARLESARTNRLLMRRYATVQKARDADVFGILVGTLGVASYLPLIKHLRAILSRAHKKSYTVSVGKLNPSKLANFMEIECFVLVACPENSVVEARDFLRPIITPYELEVALQAEQSWTGRYVLDFERLLAESAAAADAVPPNSASGENKTGENAEDEDEDDPDQPVFSLITGKYRHAKRFGAPTPTLDSGSGKGKEPESSSSDVILRNQDTALALADNAAAQFFQDRTFRGLEARVGEDAPSVLEQGRSGIARGYADDHPGTTS